MHDLHVRDWLTTDVPANWKTDQFKGLTIDLGVPPGAILVTGRGDDDGRAGLPTRRPARTVRFVASVAMRPSPSILETGRR